MELRRLAPVLVVGALAVGGFAVAACGGSSDASGTVNDPITIGTGTQGTLPGGTAQASSAVSVVSTAAEAAAGGSTTAASGEDTGGSSAAAPAGDAAAGKAVFASAGCVGCHTLKDAGATGTVGPNLDDVKPDAATVVKFVTNGAGPMPSFKGKLSDADIQNVAAYVSSVAGQ